MALAGFVRCVGGGGTSGGEVRIARIGAPTRSVAACETFWAAAALRVGVTLLDGERWFNENFVIYRIVDRTELIRD